MKKDPHLENIFESYSREAESERRLTSSAKNYLKNRRNDKKYPQGKLFALITSSVCAVLVLAVSVWSLFPTLFGGDNIFGNMDANTDNVSYYASKDIRGKTVDKSAVENFLSLDGIRQLYKVAGERFCEFYFKANGQTAYYTAEFAVESSEGRTEFRIFAEVFDGVYEKFEQAYKSGSASFNGRPVIEINVQNGEYVANAFFTEATCRYYVSAEGNVYGDAEAVINRLFS